MARLIAPALEALLSHSIDYAGLFPPASLHAEAAVAKYRAAQQSPFAWMLARFVVSEKLLDSVPSGLDGFLSVVGDSDSPRASAVETKLVLSLSKPTYCEVPLEELDRVCTARSFAKIRTGGVTPEAIPSVAGVANYIHACAALRLPFKATAGLHHPVRAEHGLTYASDAPRAVTHGFINVLLAAAFAWHGANIAFLCQLLDETDASSFHFTGDRAHWRDHFLDLESLRSARRDFVHSFGSCSFDDPVAGLQELGWL